MDRDLDWAAVAARARAGDGTAFASIVRATQRDVWRLCAYLVDAGTADDLSQETYLRAVRALPSYAGEAPIRHWILAIARRVCADELRQRTRRRRLFGRLAPQPSAPDAAGEVELRLLLAALHPDRREAFVLTQVIGLSYDEAAQVAGCPVGTIRSRVARARGDLAEALRPTDTGTGTAASA